MRRADFCPFDLLMTCPYKNQCRGESQSTVTVNVYTNSTVIVNAFIVMGAMSPVIVNVYSNGSVNTYGCYKA